MLQSLADKEYCYSYPRPVRPIFSALFCTKSDGQNDYLFRRPIDSMSDRMMILRAVHGRSGSYPPFPSLAKEMILVCMIFQSTLSFKFGDFLLTIDGVPFF